MMSKIGEYVSKRIDILSKQKDTPSGRARLARLRCGVGKTPGELPELWGEFLSDLPEDMLSRDGVPTQGEWAIYLALTLYALHQQGSSDIVHKKGEGLGRAAAQLMDDNTDEALQRVLRRFAPVVTAKDMPELSHHLRSMIQLFSANGIVLDYVRLAEDIYKFQYDDGRKSVQLRWGQDFYYQKGEE